MPDDELMSISRFAHLSGVTVHMLRHYDEIGILSPAEVDHGSGYRRYDADQIRVARLIWWLRSCDAPIEVIKQILAADAAGDDMQVKSLLRHHRALLTRQHDHQSARIDAVDRFLERGLPMDAIRPGCHPVQIKMAVDDHTRGVSFYRDALGLGYQVARRTASMDRSAFVFGEYSQPGFFLIWLLDDRSRLDLPGRSNMGFLVDDVDAVHRRALDGGAVEVTAPRGDPGTERHSAVSDPWGNWIRFQGGGTIPRPARLVLAVDDRETAVAFYRDAFELRDQVAPAASDEDSPAFVFGATAHGDYFQLVLSDDHDRVDQPGRSNFSFLVDDLDAVHRRAVAAGATEMSAPRDAEGMPRSSGIADPFGNMIGLAQA